MLSTLSIRARSLIAMSFLVASCGAQMSKTASSLNVNDGITELNRKKELFKVRTGVFVGCFTASSKDCVVGIDKLLDLANTQGDIFKVEKFESIMVDKIFTDVTTMGVITIDFKGTPDAITQHIKKQSTQYPEMQRKRIQFSSATKIKVGCYITELPACVASLDKLLTLSTTTPDLFKNAAFNLIVIDTTFQNVTSSGYVQISYKGSIDEIKAHLQKQ